MLLIALLAAAAGPVRALDPPVTTRLADALRCHLGVYAQAGGEVISITGSGGAPRTLRYTRGSGEFDDVTQAEDGVFRSGDVAIAFEPCPSKAMTFTHGGTEGALERLALREIETRVHHDGITLHGKLVVPVGVDAPPVAVWIEGSNNSPSTDDSVWPYELARRGVATLVYDKRGTGSSTGAPSANVHVRAGDTAAAVREARRLLPQSRRVGVIGGSQGGWVAPLTTTLVDLDFVIVAFGLAESPIRQDQAVVMQQLAAAGYGEDVMAQARELTRITERIVRSDLASGLDALDAFKQRHGGDAWLAAIQPRSYTGVFLRYSSAEIRANGPALAQGFDFGFEPRPLIETMQARQLWLLGGQDTQAPNRDTQAILEAIRRDGRKLDVVVFPHAEHGLVERDPDTGAPRFPPTLFDLVAAWIQPHDARPDRTLHSASAHRTDPPWPWPRPASPLPSPHSPSPRL
ncbi:MAG: alpha/beta hydrolase family protein [Silanimonas sp.]